MQGLTSRTAITIAHEIAHTMGVVHDDLSDERCNQSHYVMSPSLGGNATTNSQWSICSREQISNFLQSPDSKCLLHNTALIYANSTEKENTVDDAWRSGEQEEDHLSVTVPGGIKFEADHQCQLLFGRPDATVCNHTNNKHHFCQELW